MAKEIRVHSFRMGDVEDPYIMAADPLYKWEQTDKGKWIKKHATETPVFYCKPDHDTWGYKVEVYAKLNYYDTIYYYLKWHEV